MQSPKGKIPPQFARFAKKPISKKPVTAAQAQKVATRFGKKAPVMDAEDLADGGADENTEKN